MEQTNEIDTRKLKVLIADAGDNADSLALLLNILGHQAIVAHSTEEAIAATRINIDVLIAERGAPRIDGLAVASHYKEHSPRTKRIAVLGIKTPETGQPAYYVAEYAKRAGYDIVPVPVYYPEVTEILGEPVYRSLAAIPGEVDMVDVFRRARDIDAHVDDILAKRPASVWFQLGIRNDAVAERLAREGIDVVQDRCLLVEIGAIGR